MHKIAIIVPLYNVQDYIGRCVDSIIDQECDDFKIECLLVNDCTLDNTMGIINDKVNTYSGSIEFIIVNHEVNKGLSSARNTGISNASGDFVLFVDSDDRLPSGALKNMVDALDNSNYASDVDIVIGNTWICKDAKTIMGVSSNNALLLKNSGEEALRMFLKKNIYHSAWNKLIRRDLLLKYGLVFESGIIMEDLLWSYLVFLHAREVLVLPQITYYYENNPNSIMNTFEKNVTRVINSFIIVIDRILNNPPKRSFVDYYMYIFYILIRVVDVFEIHKTEKTVAIYNESINNIRNICLNQVLYKQYYFCYLFFLTSRFPYNRILRCWCYRRFFNKIVTFVSFITKITHEISK